MLIRPVRFRDLPALQEIFSGTFTEEYERRGVDLTSQFGRWQQMYPLVRALALFPNPYQYLLNLHVAVEGGEIAGFIQTSPGNRDHTRWHVDYLAVAPTFRGRGVGQALLDFTFEHHPFAKSFTVEIDTRNLPAAGLATRKGFRRYATLHYYQLPAEKLALCEPAHAPAGLHPYRAKDAEGLLQLHNACTPSPMRLIDSRSVADFEMGLVERTLSKWRSKLGFFEDMRYVVSDDRKRVIGYLRLIAQYRSVPHSIQFMVHPGYEDMAEPLLRYGLAKLRPFPQQVVLAWVPDYQPALMTALEQAEFTLLTADHLFVRDTLLTIRMPNRGVAGIEENAFKPAFCEPPR